MSNTKKQKLLRRIKNRITAYKNGDRSHASPLIAICLFVLILAGGVTYIIEINATAATGFQIRSLQQKVQQLEKVQKELEFRQSDAQSLDALQAKASSMQMVAVDTIETLSETGAVALKD